MIYLFLDNKQIKLLYLKKSLLGQYEFNFFEKKHEVNLLNEGKVADIDLLASAIKDVLNSVFQNINKEREIVLILPQESFYFIRTEVPIDVASSAIVSFIEDKARNNLPVDINDCLYDFFIKDNDKQKQITFFAMNKDRFTKYQDVFNLLDLKLNSILPETLAYYKLFEKTLKAEKKESIFFVHSDESLIKGYLYDNYGLLSPDFLLADSSKDPEMVNTLKEQIAKYETKSFKLNRIIISGSQSEKIRQDTFTKSVGVWTNPLKRIIPNFYQDYLKILVSSTNKLFPILNFDACFGAFIFCQENKDFSLLRRRKQLGRSSSGSGNGKKINLSKFFNKEILIFVASFIASFVFFVLISKYLPQIKKPATKVSEIKPTPTLLPTVTPTPSIKREDLHIKILNGSGTKGKASEVKDILKGYGEILTSNADNFDYESTIIKTKKTQKEAFDILKNDLKDYLPAKIISETLDEKETADVVIIVGKDFK